MTFGHVQLAIPRGGENDCRLFYCGLLGWTEIAQPEALRARGGQWLDARELRNHFGVEEPFRPARKAHQALGTPERDDLAGRLEAAGHAVTPNDLIPGRRRFCVADPSGNRFDSVGDEGA